MEDLEEVAGGDQQKLEMMITIAQIENRGNKSINLNAHNEDSGALGPYQFIKSTGDYYGVKDRTDFKQSAQGVSNYIDDIKKRYGDKFTPAAFYGNYIAGNELSNNIAYNNTIAGKNVGHDTKQYMMMAEQLHNEPGV